jgi:hypothetical protein
MTTVVTNEIARSEAVDFARRLAEHWQELLGMKQNVSEST